LVTRKQHWQTWGNRIQVTPESCVSGSDTLDVWRADLLFLSLIYKEARIKGLWRDDRIPEMIIKPECAGAASAQSDQWQQKMVARAGAAQIFTDLFVSARADG
jgi:hypothetical protein